MSSLFKSILVPVDFSGKTEAAIDQAIELACHNGSTIHLLYNVRPIPAWPAFPLFNYFRSALTNHPVAIEATARLKVLKENIERSLANCKVIIHSREGNVFRNIQCTAAETNPEIIVISHKKHNKFYSQGNCVCPNGLASSTGYPVLTLMKDTSDTKIKTIVVPVTHYVPDRKITMAIELAKKYRAAIHLVTMPAQDATDQGSVNAILETYRNLRSVLTNPIEYHILKGKNMPKAILEYATNFGADLILVNPGPETSISKFTGKQINDALVPTSGLKILSIAAGKRHEIPADKQAGKPN